MSDRRDGMTAFGELLPWPLDQHEMMVLTRSLGYLNDPCSLKKVAARIIRTMMRSYPTTRGFSREQASRCFPAASPILEEVRGKHVPAPQGRVNRLNFLENFGAGEAIRTPDPNLGKVVLYP